MIPELQHRRSDSTLEHSSWFLHTTVLPAPMAGCADILAALLLLSIGIIVCTASLLALILRRIRQPKVIVEVLGGILLGA
jgi:hypothetical protein